MTSNQQGQAERVKDDFLLLLLRSIDEGLTPKAIAKKVGRTKQALNYHLKRMQALKVVIKVQSYPWAIYKLTSLGRQVKDSLVQSDVPIKRLWKAQNLIVGFKIHTFGSFNFIDTKDRKICQMQNWKYAREEVDGYVINVHDTGLLKIYCKEEYTQDPDIAFGKMFAEAQRLAQFYVDRYDMKLNPMHVIRKGEKSLCGSEQLAKIFGRFKLPEVYINASDGPEHIEEKQGNYDVEKLLSMPGEVKAIRDELKMELMPVLQKLTEQITLHLDAVREMRDSAKEMKETAKAIRDALKKDI